MDLSFYSTSTIATAAACFGAAIVSAYVVWGPDYFFKTRGQCLGLTNLGNTCFMNAVLQGLAALPPVKEWLVTISDQQSTGPLATALIQVLTVLSVEEEGEHSPAAVLRALRHHRWSIDYQQQDAHELYHVLLTTLTEEMTPCPSLLSELQTLLQSKAEGSLPRSMALTRSGRVYTPKKSAKCPLQGLLTSELLCCVCHHTFPMQYELFDSLSLTLPTLGTQCTLQSCMADYVKSEVVQEVECPQCSSVANKKVKCKFYKRLSLGRPPDCLCIHFKRTVWGNNGQLYKNDSFISFPLHLDITHYLKAHTQKGQQEPTCKYRLCAVIEHMGGPLSGHYQTYRRVGGKQWVRTSDTSVYLATTNEVINCTAYMLFYRKL